MKGIGMKKVSFFSLNYITCLINYTLTSLFVHWSNRPCLSEYLEIFWECCPILSTCIDSLSWLVHSYESYGSCNVFTSRCRSVNTLVAPEMDTEEWLNISRSTKKVLKTPGEMQTEEWVWMTLVFIKTRVIKRSVCLLECKAVFKEAAPDDLLCRLPGSKAVQHNIYSFSRLLRPILNRFRRLTFQVWLSIVCLLDGPFCAKHSGKLI